MQIQEGNDHIYSNPRGLDYNENARSKLSKVIAMWINVNYGGLYEVRDDATLSYGK
jgi:hypothetical protein